MPATPSRPATAMLLAAGRGERMRPLSDHTPKPMLPVKGKPLMQWAMESMQRAGVQGLVVAGTGNGSISSKMKESLVRAQIEKVQIRLSSRCHQGAVVPTSGHEFDATGALSPVKTRVALLLDIMSQQQSH